MNKEFTLEESMKIYYDRDKKKKTISNKVINRRRVNMFKMLERNDGYFSEENIKRKEPFLYEIYVGWRNEEGRNKERNMSEFLFSQIDRKICEESLIKEIEKYGREEVLKEYLNVDKVNKQSSNKKEDDIDELIRIMMLNYLYSDEQYDCDNNSDLDYNDKENDNYDEENYFTSD